MIDFAMANLSGARAWRVELQDAAGGFISLFSQSGDLESIFPSYRITQSALRTACVGSSASFGWIEGEIAGERECIKAKKVHLFHFVCSIGSNEILAGGVIFEQMGFSGSPFLSETQFVKFLRGLATSAIRERRLENEEWALRRLLSSLAIQCVLIDRSGKVIFQSTSGDDEPDADGGLRKQSPIHPKALVKTILARYAATKSLKAGALTVATVSVENHEQRPLYIMPLSKNPHSGDAELLALLMPRPTAPPSSKALAAALALTAAEAKVVQRMAAGKNIRRIAEEMTLTEQTVRTYLKRIYAKLGVSSQCELIAKVIDVSIPFADTQSALSESAVNMKS